MAKSNRKPDGDDTGAEHENNGAGSEAVESAGTGSGDAILTLDVAGFTGENPEIPREPETIIAAEPVKKKRGRPKGSGTGKSAKAAGSAEKTESVDLGPAPPRPYSSGELSILSYFYMTGNNFVAMNYKAPDFVIDASEAQTVAEPLSEVLAGWGIYLSAANSPYAKLIAAIVGVYGARVVGRYMATAAKKSEMQQQAANDPNVRPVAPNQTERNKPVVTFDALVQAEQANAKGMN